MPLVDTQMVKCPIGVQVSVVVCVVLMSAVRVMQSAVWEACVLPGLGLLGDGGSHRCQRVSPDVWSRLVMSSSHATEMPLNRQMFKDLSVCLSLHRCPRLQEWRLQRPGQQ